MDRARLNNQNGELPFKWTDSPDYPSDARFLWHGYWFPRRTITTEHSHGLSLLIGWDKTYFLKRCSFWTANQIVVQTQDSIIIPPSLFRLFEGTSSTSAVDRMVALQRVLKLIIVQIEGNRLASRAGQEWIFDVINHWKTIDEICRIRCKGEIETLEQAANKQLKSERLGKDKFATQSFKNMNQTQRISY